MKNTLLVVEDNLPVRMTTVAYLKKAGFEVLEAGNGEIALEVIQDVQNSVDLVLLDLSMPRLNGQEFLDIIRNNPVTEKLPVFVVTTSTDNSDLVNSVLKGADAYFTKPLDFDKLNEKLDLYLS